MVGQRRRRFRFILPEPPKGELSAYWSRRIDDQHRLVYRATDDEIKILKARYRY